VFRKPIRKALGADEDSRIVFQVDGAGRSEKSDVGNADDQAAQANTQETAAYYEAGLKANHYLVGINEVSTDGYGGKATDDEFACGIIISKTKKMLVIMSSPNAVRGINLVQVTFYNGQTVRARVTATDSETGISIIRVEMNQLDKDTLEDITVAKLGKSYALKRGENVVAVGNPLSEIRSLAVGQYTSVGGRTRMTDREYSLLETNILGKRHMAGFLVDEEAVVMGVVTHREDEDGENYTIKALAISDLSVLTDVLCNQKVRPFIGVQISTVSTETARAYGIPKGVYVEYVYLRSPAVDAGIQKGDILVAIGKKEIRSTKYFAETLDQLSPGTTVKVQFMRYTNGRYKRMSADVVIAER
jgi:S1-C subfamily serine protease